MMAAMHAPTQPSNVHSVEDGYMSVPVDAPVALSPRKDQNNVCSWEEGEDREALEKNEWKRWSQCAKAETN